MANFNTTNIMNACIKMNEARRNILSELNRMKTVYGQVGLDYWNGASRIHFHEVVFGVDGESGLVGSMGNSPTNGLCKGLNDLLYMLSTYIVNVVNTDRSYTDKYAFLSQKDFAEDYQNPVTIAPVETFIDYLQLSAEKVAINKDILISVERQYYGNIENIFNYVTEFEQGLNECIYEGIYDYEITDGLSKVLNLLKERVEKFRLELRELLEINDDLVTVAEQEKQNVVERNAGVAQILARFE